MLKRALVWTAVALAGALLAAASLSWTPATAIRITDDAGEPAADAYARYYYAGRLLNFVHSVTYVAGGSVIARADADGRIVIPARLHVRRPLPISTPPRVFIANVYVPRLHNAFGSVAASTSSSPGLFAFGGSHAHMTMFDISGHPDAWEASLRELFSLVAATMASEGSAPMDPDDTETRGRVRELMGHVRREYAAFVERYGDARRTRPQAAPHLTDEERRAWEAQIDAHIAREPLWGPFLERTWRQNLNALDAMEASLP